MMAYPVGDTHGGSLVTLLCVLVAAWRSTVASGRRCGAAGGPFGLGLIAALLGRYPYGGDRPDHAIRGAVDLPAGGTGAGGLCARISPAEPAAHGCSGALLALSLLGLWSDRPGTWSRPTGSPTTSGLASSPAGSGPRRPGCRARLPEDRSGALVRPEVSGRSACRQCTCFTSGCSPSGTAGTSRSGWIRDEFSEDRPLRLVAFDHLPSDVSALRQWLARLGRSFELRRTETYVIQPGKPKERTGCAMPMSSSSGFLARGSAGTRPWPGAVAKLGRPTALNLPNRSGQRGWAKIS